MSAESATERKTRIYLIGGGSDELKHREFALKQRNALLKLAAAMAILLPLMIFAGFINLSAPSFHHRDETTHVRVTQEMKLNGNYFEPAAFGVGYDNKPPFKMWLSLVPISVLGESNISYRLIDVVAGLGTVLLVFFFARALFDSTFAGLTAGVALLGCRAYAMSHGYRQANQDSLLIFFSTLIFILGWRFVRAVDSAEMRRAWWLAAAGGVVVGCAALTKNVAGFIPLAPLGLFLLFRGGILAFLRQGWKPLVLLGALGIVIPALYVIPHCVQHPGACTVMFRHEVAIRATRGYHNVDNYQFYLIRLFRDRVAVSPFLLVLGCGLAVFEIFRRRDQRFLFLLCWLLLPIAVFSFIPSRLTWYIAPTYPAMAILAGGVLAYCARVISTSGLRWWKGKAQMSLSLMGSSAVLLGGMAVLTQHQIELAEVLLNPQPRAPFDTLIREIQSSVAPSAVSERRLIVYRHPDLARNEIVYRDFLANRIVAVENEAALRTELEKNLGDFILADPHHFAAVQRIRPMNGYTFLAPYKVRTDWIFVGSFAPLPAGSQFTSAKQVIQIGSDSSDRLFGWGKKEALGGITTRRSRGSQSAVAFQSDLAHREFGADLSLNAAKLNTLRGVPVVAEVLLNGRALGEITLNSSRLSTFQLSAPPDAWQQGRNVFSFRYRVEGKELTPEDEAVVFNWLSIKLR